MQVTKKIDGTSAVVTVEGWLDTKTSPEFGAALDDLEGAKNVTLDFDAVEYIASSGLREIVNIYKKTTAAGGEFAIINVSSDVMDVFKLTGFDKRLNISAK